MHTWVKRSWTYSAACLILFSRGRETIKLITKGSVIPFALLYTFRESAKPLWVLLILRASQALEGSLRCSWAPRSPWMLSEPPWGLLKPLRSSWGHLRPFGGCWCPLKLPLKAFWEYLRPSEAFWVSQGGGVLTDGQTYVCIYRWTEITLSVLQDIVHFGFTAQKEATQLYGHSEPFQT